MVEPVVSIITPFYNSAKYLDQTIQSVIGQSFPQWEHILVDDGSEDGSLEIAKQYASDDRRITWYARGRATKGVNTCRNIGLGKARGRYVLFLDSDDLLNKACIENRLKEIETIDKLDFGVFNMEYFQDEPGDCGEISNSFPDDNTSYLEMYLAGLNPWQTPCTLWSSSFLKELGGWDEDFLRITDPDLHTRALLWPDVRAAFFESHPVDCYYRRKTDPGKTDHEWLKQSILGRIRYNDKAYSLMLATNSVEHPIQKLQKALENGILRFFKVWGFSRAKDFRHELHAHLHWVKANKLLRLRDRILLKWLINLWAKDSGFIRVFRLKGLLIRMLP